MHAHAGAQLTLEGADQIFGLVTFWAAVNRKVDIRVVRMGEQHHSLYLLRMSHNTNEMLCAMYHPCPSICAALQTAVVDLAVPKGDRMMVNAIQTWTPWLWPTFLLHPPVWYQHILLSTADSAAGCVRISIACMHAG